MADASQRAIEYVQAEKAKLLEELDEARTAPPPEIATPSLLRNLMRLHISSIVHERGCFAADNFTTRGTSGKTHTARARALPLTRTLARLSPLQSSAASASPSWAATTSAPPRRR